MNNGCKLICSKSKAVKYTVTRVEAVQDGVFQNQISPRTDGGKAPKGCPDCGASLVRIDA